MNWVEALKAWNAKHGGRWQIPKKGTPEYEQVRRLMTTKRGGMDVTPKRGRPAVEPGSQELPAHLEAVAKQIATMNERELDAIEREYGSVLGWMEDAEGIVDNDDQQAIRVRSLWLRAHPIPPTPATLRR